MKVRLDNGPLLAALLAVFLMVWMASGLLGNGASAQAETDPATGRTLDRGVVSVQVRTQQAEPIDQHVILHGTTAPDRAITLRAPRAGSVARLGVREGQTVERSATVVELDPEELPARLLHARDLLIQRQLEYKGAERLHKQNLLSDAGLAESRAKQSSAQAELSALEAQLAQMQVRAPFPGTLDAIHVEVGDYLKSGEDVARLLSFRPALVVGHVSETEGSALAPGMPGTGTLRDGTRITGTVRHISAEADPQARTYRVEFALSDNQITRHRAGSTARVEIRVGRVQAHRISPALLALDNTGRLGVKVVDEEERARFLPVRLVRASSEGAWIDGLPARVRLITVGAGFVKDGDRVRAVPEPAAAGTPAA